MSDQSHKRWRASPEMKARAGELRRKMTPAERKLWARIRFGQLDGAHFRRQHAVDRFIVDFFCARAKLVVEVDGDSHATQAEYDAARTECAERTEVRSDAAIHQRRGAPQLGGRAGAILEAVRE